MRGRGYRQNNLLHNQKALKQYVEKTGCSSDFPLSFLKKNYRCKMIRVLIGSTIKALKEERKAVRSLEKGHLIQL